MNDILLKSEFVDRAAGTVYSVHIVEHQCNCCGKATLKDVGQKIRFDLDGDHRLKVDNVWVDIDDAG